MAIPETLMMSTELGFVFGDLGELHRLKSLYKKCISPRAPRGPHLKYEMPIMERPIERRKRPGGTAAAGVRRPLSGNRIRIISQGFLGFTSFDDGAE